MPELALTDHTYLRVLDESLSIVEEAGVPYGVIGGLASVVVGRPRRVTGSADIDLFLRPDEVDQVLASFERRGFDTERHEETWIYKARKDGITVDLIFRSSGEVYLDEQMVRRLRTAEFEGRRLRVVSPEDLLVMKAVAHNEETPQYWHDAVGIVARGDLDWDYLVERARRHGPRRVLALLLYAQSDDHVVPASAIDGLYRAVRES
ncbi:MAG TPA: nucleotidyltransferase [Actinomycetota bacterium]|nr:nucleotidyltransferase [Actinomycetota bacterium]